MRRLLPIFIICFAILGFSKLMSILNSDSSIIDALTIHADNKTVEDKVVDSQDEEKQQPKIQNKVNIVDENGTVVGSVYNLDTSQIQKITTCEKLYDLNFSPEEVQILQTLRIRNNAIQELEKDLELKQAMLNSIQQEIDKRITKLEKLSAQIESNDSFQSDSATYSKLVKIYEGMKPKDAAKIFNELQISVMIGVAQQMKDNKLSAIVSEMQPEKARDLTMALATAKHGD